MNSHPVEPIFHLWRYQILPLSQTLQVPLDRRIQSIEELTERKNEIFEGAVTHLRQLNYPRAEVIHKFLGKYGDVLVLRIGSRKRVSLHTREFDEKVEEDWPSVFVCINNKPDIQTAAIQFDRKVFKGTEPVAHLLEKNLNRVLRRENLGVYFEPIFEETEFWHIVDSYPNRIVKATFELVSPNMARLSKRLTFDFASFVKSTNTKRTKIELNSERDATLTLSQDDKTIKGLVEHASGGGGNISLKIKGIRKTFTTADSIKETTIDEAILTAEDPKVLATQLKMLLDA